MEKFKKDILKWQIANEEGKNETNLQTIHAKEEARQKRNEKERETLWQLRGPESLLALKSADREKRNCEVSSEEEKYREKRLFEEIKGHKSEDYEWDPKDFREPEPESEGEGGEQGERDGEGDFVMGGLDSENVSPTSVSTPISTRTLFEIEDRLKRDLQNLLEDGIKKVKEYDQYVDRILARYKMDLAAGAMDADEARILKNAGMKVQTAPSLPGLPGGTLKRKSVSMQSPSDTLTGILKKASIQSPSDAPTNVSKRLGSIQSPIENNGSPLRKSVSIQTPTEVENNSSNGGGILKKPVLIQIPSNIQGTFTTAQMVDSPVEATGSALKRVRLNDDPFWTTPTSPSPLSSNPPIFPVTFSFPANVPKGPVTPPTNAPTGPASSRPSRRPSNPLSLPQSPATPNGPAASASSDTSTPRPSHPLSAPQRSSSEMAPTTPIDRQSPSRHIGKTFKSSINWASYPGNVYNLKMQVGDEIEIEKHVNGESYIGFNKTSQRTGQFNMQYFLQDLKAIEHIGKVFISSSSYSPRYHDTFYDLEIRIGDKVKIMKHHSSDAYIGLNMTSDMIGNFKINYYLGDIKSNPRDDPKDNYDTSLIGKSFIATNTWSPKSPNDSTTLEIRIGDKIEIINYASGANYTGFNKVLKKSGHFNIDHFWKDVQMSTDSLEPISKYYTEGSTQHPRNTSDYAITRSGVNPQDHLKSRSKDDIAVHVGKTFTSSHTWFPKRRGDLNIKHGDAIEIVSHNSGNSYEGYNVETRNVGQFNILFFLKDIEPLDDIGKVFTATSSQHNSDITDLRIDIGDRIKISGFRGNGVYTGNNLETGLAGRFYDQFQKDIEHGIFLDDDFDYFEYIDKVFTATSDQSPKSSADQATLPISIGNKIKITKFVSGTTFRCFNMDTGKAGNVNLEHFHKDIVATSKSLGSIKAAKRFLDDFDSSRMDVDPTVRTSAPTSASGDNQSGKFSFSIKGRGPKPSSGHASVGRLL